MDYKPVKAILKISRILDYIGAHSGVKAIEIIKNTGLPRSSVHDLLATLVREGWLDKNSETEKFTLGLKMFEFGSKARANLEIRRIVLPFLQKLKEKFDETVYFAVLEGHEMLYIESVESSRIIRASSVLGVRGPLYCTGLGKAVLAFQSEGFIDNYLKTVTLKKYMPNTITKKTPLLKEIEKIKLSGYAIDNIEHEPEVRCVGVPIFDHSGTVNAGISITGPESRICNAKIKEFAGELLKVSKNISKQLEFI